MLLRILWREFRTLRITGCWIAGLTLLAVLAAGAFGHADTAYAVGWIGTAALGLAATANAVTAEREAGTWPLYERLPLTTADLWRNKLLAAALAQTILFTAVTALAFVANGGHGPSRELSLGIGLCIPEALAWGMLAAALLDRTTTAAAGGAAAMLAVYLLLRLTMGPRPIPAGQLESQFTITPFLATYWWARLPAAALALIASLRLLRHRASDPYLSHFNPKGA